MLGKPKRKKVDPKLHPIAKINLQQLYDERYRIAMERYNNKSAIEEEERLRKNTPVPWGKYEPEG